MLRNEFVLSPFDLPNGFDAVWKDLCIACISVSAYFLMIMTHISVGLEYGCIEVWFAISQFSTDYIVSIFYF